MIKKHDYFYTPLFIKGAFSPEECREIINMQGKINDSMISKPGNIGGVDKKGRSSLTKFLDYNPENEWLAQKLGSMIQQVNTNFYHFNVSALSSFQVLEYGKDDFFNWHQDIGSGKNSTRKISIIIFLSNPKDYKGGQVRLINEDSNSNKTQEQGTVMLFPSYIPHKVEKVVKGKRFSLVAWATGPRFR